jgi:hypothetical protein
MNMTVNETLAKRAQAILEKRSFQPMPGGQPPADPNAQMQQGGQPGMPMDPSMQGGAPMDPSMMGGQPGMPMDPSMGGMMPPGMAMGGMGMPQPATIGQLSVTDFQNILTDTLMLVMQQVMGAGQGVPGAGAPPPEVAPQTDQRTVSNTELAEKVDAILAMLSGAGAGGAPMGAGVAAPEMGFGGQGFETPQAPVPAAPGMEVQGSVKKSTLADMILKKTAQARKA